MSGRKVGASAGMGFEGKHCIPEEHLKIFLKCVALFVPLSLPPLLCKSLALVLDGPRGLLVL